MSAFESRDMYWNRRAESAFKPNKLHRNFINSSTRTREIAISSAEPCVCVCWAVGWTFLDVSDKFTSYPPLLTYSRWSANTLMKQLNAPSINHTDCTIFFGITSSADRFHSYHQHDDYLLIIFGLSAWQCMNFGLCSVLNMIVLWFEHIIIGRLNWTRYFRIRCSNYIYRWILGKQSANWLLRRCVSILCPWISFCFEETLALWWNWSGFRDANKG